MSGDEERTFKSFKDLLRSTGAEPEPPAEPARGWTLETGEGAVDEGRMDSLTDRDAAARERIDARPAGFGAMDTGPPCYRDEHSEEMELVGSFRVRTVFPADVLAEVATLPRDPRPEDWAGRLDLRGRTIFTIDGEDAKDYDDAISIESVPGGVELGVHIADVSHYVRPGTALDAEALARATSVYLPDQVVPMLPEALSNHLCSLVPDRDRLAFSVLMRFDDKGRRTGYEVRKSVIHSVRRCTYKAVQELLDGADTDAARALADLAEPLRQFAAWTKRQQSIRDAKGSLRMQSREPKVQFGPDHEVTAIVDAPRYFSQTLIEETALAANQAVGDFFRQRGLPTIYRVHPEKDPEEVAAVAALLADFGLRVPEKERLTGRDVARLIQAARKKPNADALTQRIMGLVERAVYEVKDHEDVATHFGLAREAYLHFTSPIRRYPDLVVHRWLHQIESGVEGAGETLRTEAFLDDLNQVAQHASVRAEVAEMTSRAVFDLKVCQYMDPHRGETLKAVVRRVMPAGMEVHLDDYNVSAFLPTRAIGRRGEVKGPTLTIQVGRGHRSFTEGYPIAVVLREVDFLRLQLLLDLA
ncbi:MAG: VacB/RNase II family 3'-5' exoribonuclease [Planctomycetes bacterium]|nr:VacB/RNase II family 3'-5' exoribonuclease [Planctomycetota bacterium]